MLGCSLNTGECAPLQLPTRRRRRRAYLNLVQLEDECLIVGLRHGAALQV